MGAISVQAASATIDRVYFQHIDSTAYGKHGHPVEITSQSSAQVRRRSLKLTEPN